MDEILNSEKIVKSIYFYKLFRVIPMLPRLLCENLCSLNPGVERLAFSIFFQMNE